MNQLRNVALSIGVAATVTMTSFTAQAQTCADRSQTPLTKSRLDQIATNQGITLSRVGVEFEEFALNTIRAGNPVPQNNRLFPSPLRQAKAGIRNVEPDGVVPLVVHIIPFLNPQTYADSVFYESKAVKGTLLPPSYENYQILGFLDVLDSSPARAEGENPAIFFLTTSDIHKISKKTIAEANRRDIGVWHSIACEVTPQSGDLQMGGFRLLNRSVYFWDGRVPTSYGGPGSIGRL
ncbi:hypothetical protein [Gloeocapsopsis sp. IPPAS B-1203]|uniref:hypothetical protein n=1 Tax=Gloeocapsopsis sp. IPPAS B-1203 TaxID=2049454 RepID=UPI000C1A2AA4|nr:hypothetical protein [Gloeocapsopsis sp. IPPAS B-1203]PIG95062.1 hypothetical protein CSQ79_00900 [Gloeocapsopsis sp. IPPAS B-1203]